MYAVGFVAAAQVIGVDIAPLIAVGEWVQAGCVARRRQARCVQMKG
jgi:hypothetical protein